MREFPRPYARLQPRYWPVTPSPAPMLADHVVSQPQYQRAPAVVRTTAASLVPA